MENLNKYIDYRKFLRDYYSEQKNRTRYFSYRYFAKMAGINSPGFIKDVFEGKRNLTASATEKFASALGLTKKDTTFFRHLVMFNQAKSAEEKQEHYRVIVSMMNLVHEYELSADQYSYFDNWYTCVIRELVCIYDFKGNYALLGAMVRPQIKANQAREAVALLERLKMIIQQKEGTYIQSDPALTSGHEGSAMILQARRAFNRTMIEHALASMETLPVSARNVSGITMALSESGYRVMLTELAAFKERIVTIANQDKDYSGVYQVNFQIFPVSEDIRRIEELNKELEQ